MNKLLGIRLALIVFFLILLGLATHLLFSYLGTACDSQTDDRDDIRDHVGKLISELQHLQLIGNDL